MLRLAALLLLVISSIVTAAPVTLEYQWTVQSVQDPAADALLGKVISGTFVFDEVTKAAGSGMSRYQLTSHTISLDSQTLTGVGLTNSSGINRHALTVVNDYYGPTLGDAIVLTSTVSGSTYSGMDIRSAAAVFLDTTGLLLDDTGISEADLKAGFELSDGRLFVNAAGVDQDILVSSQGVMTWVSGTGDSWSSLMDCPASPSSTNATRDWTVCDVKSATIPGFTANGIDYLMSYAVPKVLSPSNKGRIKIYMHPSTPGDAFVSGTFTPESDEIQIRVTEQGVYTAMSGSWWGYSGYNQSPELVDNYNGKIIAAAIDYVVENYGDIIDLDLGIELTGASLGGTGSFIQSQILPKYQQYVTTASSFYGIMNPIEDSEGKFSPGWGTFAQSPTLFDSTDLRTQYASVVDVHYHWAGGQDDVLGSISPNVLNTCEAQKLSCSFSWLQSGHGVSESGYILPSDQWMNSDQDVTLDKILPVITNNTSNHNGLLRGYHNRSIWWDHANITEDANTITIPIAYTAMTGIGPELPDQPATATFSVTPRHIASFALYPGMNIDWVFGAQSGSTVVGTDGLLTIDNLTLTSAAGYTNLVITHGTGTVVANSIVYTEVARTTGTHTVTKLAESQVIDFADLFDFLPESNRPFYSFNAPGNLVLRTPAGVRTVIHDCMTSNSPCVPMDPAVSFDGTKIAYALFSASCLTKAWNNGWTLPQDQLCSTGAEASIHIYDIATQTTTSWPHTSGDRDSGPTWLPDGRIMFTSSRSGYIQPYLNNIGTGTFGLQKQTRLWIANADGSSPEDAGQHELTQALHPYTLSSGRVAYGSHWMSHNLPYYNNNGSINWPTTTGNMWALQDVDHSGGDMTSLLGGHRNTFTATNGRTKTLKVLHLHGERANGDICVDNYYRANNQGLGDILCWPPEPKGVEGAPNSFLPRGLYTAFEWSKSNDEPSFSYGILGIGDLSNNYLGKVGWPEGLPDGNIMATVCRGYCSQIGASVTSSGATLAGRTAASIGIYKTTVVPSLVPEDLELVVDDPDLHEFGARLVAPRTVATPTLSTTGDSTCELVSTDAGTAETSHHTSYPYDFNDNYRTSANNGGEIDGIPHSDVVGIKFFEPVPRQLGESDPNNSTGGLMKILGTVPLLADKSFKVKLNCNTPYLMAGVDVDGRVLKRDQLAQSLRTGEKRICTGCHLHSEEGRAYNLSDAFPSTAFDLTAAAVAAPTYTADIKPIFDAKCASCHNPADDVDDVDHVPLWVWEELAEDHFQNSVPDSMKFRLEYGVSADTYNEQYGFQRPYRSKYVNSMFARESLLYWKAVNERTDGRSDASYSDDIDFGADHPTTLTSGEIDTIADWLDTGATK